MTARNASPLPAPFAGLSRVLVVAAHPDDDVLGCGGTVARLCAHGVAVDVVILASGALSRADGTTEEVAALADAARQAAKILGTAPPRLLGLPDNRLDSLPLLDIIAPLEAVIHAVQPQVVLTHHGSDLNIDHVRAHEAVLTACRPVGRPSPAILTFETVSSTEWRMDGAFNPALFVDISAHWARKTEALSAYAMEMRPWPHARSPEALEALARWRGASAGLPMAEAFMVLRWTL
jgi:LmbE family N-acetylglucosaminyl deacetylase